MDDWKSKRKRNVLILTSDHIFRLYRASVLFFLESDLLQELAWLDGISLQHLKNYQIW